ncbi:hypothetical protein [Thalassobellus suaedae]|uniref:Beta-carotene 15,15'-monooxygenase n=2 Tax=Thalassobellus suaedae TaxID=3074124 RepID=A0ABY9XYY8_9FLAO|nr:hypothetical protein RHP49_09385 [Flavobacteriaceae bacterium HL-DH10]
MIETLISILKMNTLDGLLKKIDNAPALDFGTIINDCVELYKKVWLKGFLMVLFIVIAGILIGLFFSAIGLGTQTDLFENGFNFKSFSKFYSMNAIYSLPQTILTSTLTLLFVGAFYRICKQVDSGINENDDYFYFFKKEYFSKIFMLGIIYAAIATVAQVLFMIPYIYVFVPLSYFAIVLANNPDFTETEIIKASFAIGNKKWLITFGTMFIAGIIAMLGILGCGIGLLFTLSIVYFPVFFIYKEVVGFEETSEIDQIGMHEDESSF